MNEADAKAALVRLDELSRAVESGNVERVLALAREAYEFGRNVCQTLATMHPDDPTIDDAINGMAYYFESLATAVVSAQGWAPLDPEAWRR